MVCLAVCFRKRILREPHVNMYSASQHGPTPCQCTSRSSEQLHCLVCVTVDIRGSDPRTTCCPSKWKCHRHIFPITTRHSTLTASFVFFFVSPRSWNSLRRSAQCNAKGSGSAWKSFGFPSVVCVVPAKKINETCLRGPSYEKQRFCTTLWKKSVSVWQAAVFLEKRNRGKQKQKHEAQPRRVKWNSPPNVRAQPGRGKKTDPTNTCARTLGGEFHFIVGRNARTSTLRGKRKIVQRTC